MSALSVTDVPEEISATKAGGGGASPLPRLRAFLGSHLLGVQARSGLPECEVSQTAHGGATQVDVPSCCGTDFPRNAPRSGRACSEILEGARSTVTGALQGVTCDGSRDVDMGQLAESADVAMLNCGIPSGFDSAGPLLADLGDPSERSARSVSAPESCMLDVSSKTDHLCVSHTSQSSTNKLLFNQEQLSRLAEQVVPAGPDQQSMPSAQSSQ